MSRICLNFFFDALVLYHIAAIFSKMLVVVWMLAHLPAYAVLMSFHSIMLIASFLFRLDGNS